MALEVRHRGGIDSLSAFSFSNNKKLVLERMITHRYHLI